MPSYLASFVMAASLRPHPFPPTFALTYPLARFNPISLFPSLISSFSQCQAFCPPHPPSLPTGILILHCPPTQLPLFTSVP